MACNTASVSLPDGDGSSHHPRSGAICRMGPTNGKYIHHGSYSGRGILIHDGFGHLGGFTYKRPGCAAGVLETMVIDR